MSWLLDRYDYDVSAVVVNYNGRALLERTLETLFAAQRGRSLEVIVVDNASVDGSLSMVRARFPEVRCIANSGNAGLTRANNQGMRAATGRLLFLPDNDVIVQPGAVEALADYLDGHPEVGAAGSKVLNLDGSIQGTVKNLPTPSAAVFGRHALLTRWFPANPFSRRYLLYIQTDFTRPFVAGSVARCAMMVTRTAVERAGPMDERFFVYWSDVDWCRAIWAAGLEVHCVPDSVVIHDEHQGALTARRPRSRRSIFDFHTGAYIYYRKWLAPRGLPLDPLAAAALAARALLVLASEQVRWKLHHARVPA